MSTPSPRLNKRHLFQSSRRLKFTAIESQPPTHLCAARGKAFHPNSSCAPNKNFQLGGQALLAGRQAGRQVGGNGREIPPPWSGDLSRGAMNDPAACIPQPDFSTFQRFQASPCHWTLPEDSLYPSPLGWGTFRERLDVGDWERKIARKPIGASTRSGATSGKSRLPRKLGELPSAQLGLDGKCR